MIANVAKPELEHMRDENKASKTCTLLEKRHGYDAPEQGQIRRGSSAIRDVLFFCVYVLPAKRVICLSPQSPIKFAALQTFY